MDLFKETNKILKRKIHENEQNTRRIAENYPMLEAKVDEVAFDKPLTHEFYTSDHHHSIKMNLLFKPPVNCFRCNVGNPVDEVQAVAVNPTFGPEDGNQHLVTFANFSQNVGGFILGTTSSIIVPTTAVYNFRVTGNVTGVTVSSAAAFILSIRLGEATVVQKAWSVVAGTLNPPPSFISVDINVLGLCMTAAAGDSMSLWLGGDGIAFYSPSATVTVSMIALA